MNDTIKLMKALSDEIRVRIVNLLFNSDLYVCEIVDILKLPQSTVSRHLIILKNANIVKDTKEGLWIKYSLNNDKEYNIIKDIINNKLSDDERIIMDLNNLKERMKLDRGCKNKC